MPRKKTVVILGRFRSGTSEEGLQQGFRKAGWFTHSIDTRQTTGAPGKGIVGRIAYRVHEHYANQAVIDEFKRTFRILKPDVVLMMKRTDIPAELMKEVRSMGCKLALFYPDVHFQHRTVNEKLFKYLDILITTKTYQLDYLKSQYKNITVQYVPHGYVTDVHQPLYAELDEAEYERDILYAGNHSAYKEEFLEQLHADLRKPDMMITGPNWQGKGSKSLLSYIDTVQRRNALYADIIQRSRINVAIFAGPLVHGWQDLVSTRTFEIPAAGGFMLHIDNEEVRSFYEVGSEIDVFNTPEECSDKIRFYLTKPEVRKKMIEKSYNRTVPQYSYSERASQIIQLLNQL